MGFLLYSYDLFWFKIFQEPLFQISNDFQIEDPNQIKI